MARIVKAVEGELIVGRKVTLLSECGLETVELGNPRGDERRSEAREDAAASARDDD